MNKILLNSKLFVTTMLILMSFGFVSCVRSSKIENSIWKPYSEQAVAASVAQKKPIVIDFYADWCPVCHELDETVFSRADIQAKLAQVTTLRVDATNQEDPQVQKLAQQYDVEGLPTVIFLDSHGNEINNSRVIGFVTPQEFLQAFAMFKILK